MSVRTRIVTWGAILAGLALFAVLVVAAGHVRPREPGYCVANILPGPGDNGPLASVGWSSTPSCDVTIAAASFFGGLDFLAIFALLAKVVRRKVTLGLFASEFSLYVIIGVAVLAILERNLIWLLSTMAAGWVWFRFVNPVPPLPID